MLRQGHLGLLAVPYCALWHAPCMAMPGDCCLQRCRGFVLATELDMQQEWRVPMKAKGSSYTRTWASTFLKTATMYHARIVTDCALP